MSDTQDVTITTLPDDVCEALLVELIEKHEKWLEERGAELYREWLDEQADAMIRAREEKA